MAAMISAPATATVASEPYVVVAEAVPVQEMDRDGTAATPVVYTTPAATDEEIEAFFGVIGPGAGADSSVVASDFIAFAFFIAFIVDDRLVALDRFLLAFGFRCLAFMDDFACVLAFIADWSETLSLGHKTYV